MEDICMIKKQINIETSKCQGLLGAMNRLIGALDDVISYDGGMYDLDKAPYKEMLEFCIQRQNQLELYEEYIKKWKG